MMVPASTRTSSSAGSNAAPNNDAPSSHHLSEDILQPPMSNPPAASITTYSTHRRRHWRDKKDEGDSEKETDNDDDDDDDDDNNNDDERTLASSVAAPPVCASAQIRYAHAEAWTAAEEMEHAFFDARSEIGGKPQRRQQQRRRQRWWRRRDEDAAAGGRDCDDNVNNDNDEHDDDDEFEDDDYYYDDDDDDYLSVEIKCLKDCEEELRKELDGLRCVVPTAPVGNASYSNLDRIDEAVVDVVSDKHNDRPICNVCGGSDHHILSRQSLSSPMVNSGAFFRHSPKSVEDFPMACRYGVAGSTRTVDTSPQCCAIPPHSANLTDGRRDHYQDSFATNRADVLAPSQNTPSGIHVNDPFEELLLRRRYHKECERSPSPSESVSAAVTHVLSEESCSDAAGIDLPPPPQCRKILTSAEVDSWKGPALTMQVKATLPKIVRRGKRTGMIRSRNPTSFFEVSILERKIDATDEFPKRIWRTVYRSYPISKTSQPSWAPQQVLTDSDLDHFLIPSQLQLPDLFEHESTSPLPPSLFVVHPSLERDEDRTQSLDGRGHVVPPPPPQKDVGVLLRVAFFDSDRRDGSHRFLGSFDLNPHDLLLSKVGSEKGGEAAFVVRRGEREVGRALVKASLR